MQINVGVSSEATHFKREGSFRLELSKRVLDPGEILKGCLIFAANRPRSFETPFMRIEQTEVVSQGRSSTTILLWRDELELANRLDTDMAHPKRALYPPGMYIWPFEIQMPSYARHCGRSITGDVHCELTAALPGRSGKYVRVWLGVARGGGAPGRRELQSNHLIEGLSSQPLQPEGPRSAEAAEPDAAMIPSARICAGVKQALYRGENSNNNNNVIVM